MELPVLLGPRADNLGNSTGGSHDLTPQIFGMPEKVIARLILENNIQNRTSTIMLITFNMVAAGFVVFLIIYDTRRMLKKNLLPSSRYVTSSIPDEALLTNEMDKIWRCLTEIHPAEVIPLMLSAAIMSQGIIFIGIQGVGLKSLWVGNCEAISQVMFLAVWIFGYVLLFFGVETAYRGFKTRRFAARGRWNTMSCCVAVVFCLILSWIPTELRKRTESVCLGSLLLFSVHWADIGLAINIVLITGFVTLGSVLVAQLLHTPKLERDERIAASRVVYYLAIGVLLFALLLPFWVRVTFFHDPGITSMMATVILNLSGFLHCFLHLLLRSNADSMSIGSVHAPFWRNRYWKFFSSTGLDMGQHLATPVTVPTGSNQNERIVDKMPIHIHHQSLSPSRTKDLGRNSSARQKADTSKSLPSPPSHYLPNIRTHFNKQSNYSLFLTKDNQRATAERPMSSRGKSSEHLLLPPRAPWAMSHDRHESEASMATVQIGLRLSNMAAYMSTIGRGNKQSLDLPIIALRSPMAPSDQSDVSIASRNITPVPPLFSSHKASASQDSPSHAFPGAQLERRSSQQTGESWPLPNPRLTLPSRAYQPVEGWI